MIKAIFFDLDGTLLDSNKKIQPTSIKALKQCKDKGIKLFIASARPPLLVKMLKFTEEENSLFDGGVYNNGGCIKIKNLCKYMFIPPELVNDTIEIVKQYENLNIALQMDNEVHAFRYLMDKSAYENWGINQEEVFTIENVLLDHTVKILIYYEHVYDSVTIIPEDIKNKLKECYKNKATIYITDKGKLIQIVNQYVNKMEGIEKIRKILNLNKDEIAVFGDDVNDIEMLSEYQYSVAMGNASQDVKAVAKIITRDNDHHGILYGIEKMLDLIEK